MTSCAKPKARAWVATVYEKDIDELKTLDWISFGVRYVSLASELGKTGQNPHVQGHIWFRSQVRMTTLQKVFGKKNYFAIMKGTFDHNATYIAKEPGEKYEWGEPPAQGSRTDLQVFHEAVKQGASDLELAEDYTAQYYKYHRGAEKIRAAIQYKNAPDSRKVDCIVLYGKTGSGKTYTAMNSGRPTYKLNPPHKWFDGYTDEKVLVIDEYPSRLTIQELLTMTDIYKYKAEIKGSFVWAQWDTVIITSNIEPFEWHTQANHAHRESMARRFKRICYFPLAAKIRPGTEEVECCIQEIDVEHFKHRVSTENPSKNPDAPPLSGRPF